MWGYCSRNSEPPFGPLLVVGSAKAFGLMGLHAIRLCASFSHKNNVSHNANIDIDEKELTLANETVMAVHKVTGIISEVPVHLLDLIPALEKATEKQIKIAHNKLETEIYGAPLKNVEATAAEAKASAPTEGGKA